MIIIPELNRFFTLEDFSRRLWRRRRRHSNAMFFCSWYIPCQALLSSALREN